ncbi:hypothetical protein [Bryobacter aggregatus]|uniref:hypothetical protein n=1 Tax=Bryobacter aggregatus TaxID=360054 RepID=UPI0004E0C4B7|nr:hypothetical protein [Bryobacter aggregatus]
MKIWGHLVKLFWDRFFASDWSTSADGLRFLLISTGSLLAGFQVLLVQKMFRQYFELNLLPSRLPYEIAAAADRGFLLVFVAFIAAILCVLRWRSLYPDATDLYVLSPMPVPPAAIYSARLASVTLCIGAFVVGVSAAWAITVPPVQMGHHSEHWFVVDALLMFLACVLAGMTILFFLVALEGLLQLLLGRWHRRVSGWIQNLLLALLIIGFPQIFRILSRGAWIHGHAGYRWDVFAALLFVPFLLSLGAASTLYGLSYLRRGQLLEGTGTPSSPMAAKLLRLVAGRRASAGLFHFLCFTLSRSAMHKTLLSAWLALTAMIVIYEISSGDPQDRKVLMFITLATAFWTLNGLVHVFEIPVEIGANWVFRILPAPQLEDANWVALQRFLLRILASLLILAVGIANWRFHTESMALRFTVLEALAILCLVEVLLSRIDFIPFTAGYAPGQRPAIQTVCVYLGSFLGFSVLGVVSLATSSSWALSFLWMGLLLVLWSRLATMRVRRWESTALRFGDGAQPEIQTIDLNK